MTFAAGLMIMAATLPVAGMQAQPSSSAAPPATIPAFSLGSSPLALEGDVRAGVFVSAVGRRAIAMGTEDGRFELWSWPIKWLHDLELSFRIPKYTDPIAGHTIAHTMIERPEGVTIEYAYEQFTVKQHVFVPLDIPAIVMLLEVDAIRPMEILARFTPDIHLAWPAGLGGQYLIWNDPARAFLMSEGSQRINAYFGSPAISQASDVLAHMLGASPPQFVLSVGGVGQQYTPPRLSEPPGRGINEHVAYIPIVLAGGEMSRDSALALYRKLIAPGAAEAEWKRRVAHEDSIRSTQLVVHSPEPALDRAVEYAKVNLDESFVCNPDLGCGVVAGYGLAGPASDRPGFGWFFGGDAAINSFAMVGVGQADHVRDGVFRFFAKYQRADGKITHEISQGAGWIDWFGKYPYAFFHGDTSPFWVLSVGEYWRQTADTALVRELWPNIKRAIAWSRATDTNGDGLMENPKAGAGALEVGDLQIGILSDVYLSGVWVSALDRFARMADAMGDGALAKSSRDLRAKALRTMESRLWMPALGQYAFALLENGSVNENLTAWPATAMAFDVFDPERGARMATLLASSEIMTDWGARPLAAKSKLFDPLHYNNGAVWPFVTGWVSLAEYKYHNPLAGKFALDAIARTGFDESRGRNPEVISGRLYKSLDTAVPQQFFATSMVLTPLIRGLLGLDVDAPAHKVVTAPHLPADWDSVRFENVPVGRDRVDVSIHRTAQRISADFSRHAAGGNSVPLDIVFSPALPLGATTPVQTEKTPGDLHATVRGVLRDRLTLDVPYDGGWSIIPPLMPPTIGSRSAAPRVLSERIENGKYVVALEGLAGRTYRFRLRAPSHDEHDVDVTFPTSDANEDGYTRRTIDFPPQ